MPTGLRHYHLRKRKVIPTTGNSAVKIMDKLIYVIAILGPVMTLPQVYKIWIDRQTVGVSLASWGTYFVLNIFWITYGIIHKSKLLVFTYFLWFIVNGLVALGVILI